MARYIYRCIQYMANKINFNGLTSEITMTQILHVHEKVHYTHSQYIEGLVISHYDAQVYVPEKSSQLPCCPHMCGRLLYMTAEGLCQQD